MENLHFSVDCSGGRPLSTNCSNIDQTANSNYPPMRQQPLKAIYPTSFGPMRHQLLEAIYPTPFGLTPRKISTSTVQTQPLTREAIVHQPANRGLGILPEFPGLVANLMDPRKTALLKSIIPSSRPLNMLQFDSSQPHLKRFIMFDHSGGKGRVILHPALLQELSSNAPDPSSVLEHTGNGDSSTADKTSGLGATLDARLMAYRKTVASGFATLQCMRNTTMCTLAEGKMEGELPNVEAQSSNRISCDGANQFDGAADSGSCAAGGNEVSCEADSGCWHENTEDLDALLSSDDEVSSIGHFTGDFLPDAPYGPDSYIQKRRRTSSISNEARAKRNTFEPNSDTVSAVAAVSPGATKLQVDQVAVEKEDCCVLKLGVVDRCSRSISEESENMQSYISGQCSSSRNARKRKIKRTVEALRKIIPGGDCMDATLVLDEVIRYVRSLQRKVEVLEATRHQNSVLLDDQH